MMCLLGHENCTSAWHYDGQVPDQAFDKARRDDEALIAIVRVLGGERPPVSWSRGHE